MTLCAAMTFDDRGICLVGDSVLTSPGRPASSRALVDEHGNVLERHDDIVGLTTRGERFQPVSSGSAVTYFGEAVCKICRLGLDSFVALAGDEQLCVGLCDALLTGPPSVAIDGLEDFVRERAERAVDFMRTPKGRSAELLFCAKGQAGRLSLMKISVHNAETGVVTTFREMRPNELALIGSGQTLLTPSDHLPSEFFARKPIPYALCLMAHWFSMRLRAGSRDQAVGAGGSFFGAGIVGVENGASGYMWDLLEIEITSRGRVGLLSKTLARYPGFIVHDYMLDITGAYPTIENRAVGTERLLREIHAIRPELNTLSAQCIVIENRAEGVGLPVGTFSLVSEAGISKLVGWRQVSGGKYSLTMNLNGRWFDFPPDDRHA